LPDAADCGSDCDCECLCLPLYVYECECECGYVLVCEWDCVCMAPAHTFWQLNTFTFAKANFSICIIKAPTVHETLTHTAAVFINFCMCMCAKEKFTYLI